MKFLDQAKRFLEPVQKDPWMYAKSFLRYSIGPVSTVITILLLKNITSAIEGGDATAFFRYLAIWTGVILGSFVLINYVIERGRITTSTRSYINIYEDSIRKILLADNTAIEKLGTGRLISIVERGFDTRNRSLADFVQRSGGFLIMLGFSAIIIGSYNIRLFFLFVAVFVAAVFFAQYFNKKVINQRNITRDLRDDRTRYYVKLIMSKFEIIQNNKVESEITELNNRIEDMYQSEKKRGFNTDMVFRIPRLGIFLIKLLVYAFIGYGILGERFTFADLVLFTTTLSLMDNVINQFIHMFFELTKNFSKIEKLRETLDTLPPLHQQENTQSFSYKKGSIELQNISFSYGEKAVVDNFSTSLQGGKKTALVGPSGGGKTTLLKMLAGYIQPDQGKVLVDGQSLQEVDITTYYKHIGYLSQDPAIFDGSIYENLMYGMHEETDSGQLRHILKLAQCDFVRDFQYRLETQIGERGVRLSGGQKQRLAIAKIMLKNPSIILLDEPTSALDSENEEQISIAMHHLFEGKTVVIAAHRLQTVKEADEILVIDQGKIIERGTHIELEKKNGIYQRLLTLQTAF